MAENTTLEGWTSILAALIADSRHIKIIYLQHGKTQPAFRLLAKWAATRHVTLHRVDRTVIDTHAGGRSHGGAVALVGPRRYLPLIALGQETANPFIAMLDGIEDPFNFGQAVRALYAAGSHGLVLRPRNWTSAAGVVARASAGASELIPIAIADSPHQAVQHFKTRGLRIVCAGLRPDAMPVYQADLSGPLLVILGGEKRGISRSILREVDLMLHLPYGRQFPQALDITSATAALAFEILRQRRYDRPEP